MSKINPSAVIDIFNALDDLEADINELQKSLQKIKRKYEDLDFSDDEDSDE